MERVGPAAATAAAAAVNLHFRNAEVTRAAVPLVLGGGGGAQKDRKFICAVDVTECEVAMGRRGGVEVDFFESDWDAGDGERGGKEGGLRIGACKS